MNKKKILSTNNGEGSLFNRQKCTSYLIKTDYRNIDALVQLEKEYGIHSSYLDATFLVLVNEGTERKYSIEFFYGLHCHSSMHLAFMVKSDELEEEMIEEFVYDLLEPNINKVDWSVVIDEFMINQGYTKQSK